MNEKITLDNFSEVMKKQLKKIENDSTSIFEFEKIDLAIEKDLCPVIKNNNYLDYLYETNKEEYFKLKEKIIKSSKLYEENKDKKLALDNSFYE